MCREEIAEKIFFDNFPIMGDTCKSAMESRTDQPSCATISITSVGLAALAFTRNDPVILNFAREQYNLALRKLTHATSHPMELPIEQSIAASFVLSIFEVCV